MPNQDPASNEDVVIIDQFDAEGLKKNLETTLAQKRHFREKFEREASEKAALAKELAELKSKNSQLPTEANPETPKPAGFDQDSFLDNLEVIRDLASDELAEVRSEAKNLGVDPIKYVKSKAGQAHLKELRSTKKNQDSTPNPSNRVPQFNGKPATAALTDEKASPADKQKAFEALIRGRGSNSSV
jgi:hypothetical protein